MSAIDQHGSIGIRVSRIEFSFLSAGRVTHVVAHLRSTDVTPPHFALHIPHFIPEPEPDPR